MPDNWNFDLHANSYKRRWQLVYQTAVPVEVKSRALRKAESTFNAMFEIFIKTWAKGEKFCLKHWALKISTKLYLPWNDCRSLIKNAPFYSLLQKMLQMLHFVLIRKRPYFIFYSLCISGVYLGCAIIRSH